MFASEINDNVINKAHCDWIIEQTKKLKALLSYDSERMVELNKTRALSAIETMKDSLTELELYIKSV